MLHQLLCLQSVKDPLSSSGMLSMLQKMQTSCALSNETRRTTLLSHKTSKEFKDGWTTCFQIGGNFQAFFTNNWCNNICLIRISIFLQNIYTIGPGLIGKTNKEGTCNLLGCLVHTEYTIDIKSLHHEQPSKL